MSWGGPWSLPVAGNVAPALGHSPGLLGGPGLPCQQQGGNGSPKYSVFGRYGHDVLIWGCFIAVVVWVSCVPPSYSASILVFLRLF